jgi:putative GTP pyrophosphokinase
MNKALLTQYETRYRDILVPIARALELLLVDHCITPRALPHIDRIITRAKSPESFATKAAKQNDDETQYYEDPLDQIQDQVAARIVVFYTDDVEPTCDLIRRYFTFAEQQTKEPKSEWEFGYFGRHFILTLPADAVPAEIDRAAAPPLFELQVRTLFQHAWSEASHDPIYKQHVRPSAEQKRLCAYASAQAWGADRTFVELRRSMTATGAE